MVGISQAKEISKWQNRQWIIDVFGFEEEFYQLQEIYFVFLVRVFNKKRKEGLFVPR